MLMDVVRALREAGIAARQLTVLRSGDKGPDAVLAVEVNGVEARFAAEVKSRAPYPGELGSYRRKLELLREHGSPLLVVPFVSESAGTALTEAGWSWGDEHGNFDLRATGFVARQRSAGSPPPSRHKTLPRGSGSYAIIRSLIELSSDDSIGATALASQAGVSQPRVSQVARQLSSLDLLDAVGHGRWHPRREDLLDRFLNEYPGPGGSENFYYTLDPLAQLAARLARKRALRHGVAVSADVGPDLISPWRNPTTLILYTSAALSAADLDSVAAQGKQDANIIVRMPADQSVFPAAGFAGEFKDAKIPLADPVQMIWDLHDLGGADRAEAAGKLRQWLLRR